MQQGILSTKHVHSSETTTLNYLITYVNVRPLAKTEKR